MLKLRGAFRMGGGGQKTGRKDFLIGFRSALPQDSSPSSQTAEKLLNRRVKLKASGSSTKGQAVREPLLQSRTHRNYLLHTQQC